MKTKKSFLERTNPNLFMAQCMLSLLILAAFTLSFWALEITFGTVPTIIITIMVVILTLFFKFWNKVYSEANPNE